MKNKGYSMIELVIVMLLISITITVLYNSYNRILDKIYSYREKIKIINLIEKNTDIIFNLKDKVIIIEDKIIYLNSRFLYESNNISDNFKRRFNGENFNKGFSIYIKNKNNNILESIVYNSSNNLGVPILNLDK